jgi:hypothetical protein
MSEEKSTLKNQEVLDALCMLRSCSLKDTRYETQLDQFRDVYNYIKDLENKIDKAIEYIKEHNCIGMNKEYIPKEYEYCCSYELLKILGDKENE